MSKRAQRVPQGCPRRGQGRPRYPKGAQGVPKSAPVVPKGAQMVPKVCPGELKGPHQSRPDQGGKPTVGNSHGTSHGTSHGNSHGHLEKVPPWAPQLRHQPLQQRARSAFLGVLGAEPARMQGVWGAQPPRKQGGAGAQRLSPPASHHPNLSQINKQNSPSTALAAAMLHHV